MRILAFALVLAGGCQHASSGPTGEADLGRLPGPSLDGGISGQRDAASATDASAPSSTLDLATPPDLATPLDLSPPTDPNAPFPTPYCNTGTLVTGSAQLTTLSQQAPFAKYTISGATRDCSTTGCSAWSNWQPEFEGALGNGSPFVQVPQLTGDGTATELELVNQYCTASNAYAGQWYGSTCTLGNAGQLGCGTYEWDLGHQDGGSGGTFCTPGELYLHETDTSGYTMTGILTTSCFEVQTTAQGPDVGTQYAMDIHGAL